MKMTLRTPMKNREINHQHEQSRFTSYRFHDMLYLAAVIICLMTCTLYGRERIILDNDPTKYDVVFKGKVKDIQIKKSEDGTRFYPIVNASISKVYRGDVENLSVISLVHGTVRGMKKKEDVDLHLKKSINARKEYIFLAKRIRTDGKARYHCTTKTKNEIKQDKIFGRLAELKNIDFIVIPDSEIVMRGMPFRISILIKNNSEKDISISEEDVDWKGDFHVEWDRYPKELITLPVSIKASQENERSKKTSKIYISKRFPTNIKIIPKVIPINTTYICRATMMLAGVDTGPHNLRARIVNNSEFILTSNSFQVNVAEPSLSVKRFTKKADGFGISLLGPQAESSLLSSAKLELLEKISPSCQDTYIYPWIRTAILFTNTDMDQQDIIQELKHLSNRPGAPLRFDCLYKIYQLYLDSGKEEKARKILLKIKYEKRYLAPLFTAP